MKRLISIIAMTVLSALPLNVAAQDEPPSWEWSDEQIEAAVNKVRAGRDLNPDTWPAGARVAVLLSFDVDNETIWLRNNDTNVGGLSQGEYGARVALGRIVSLLDEATRQRSSTDARRAVGRYQMKETVGQLDQSLETLADRRHRETDAE